jgi:DNA-directed RNA polymerase sigma subunit (sigma70/sigma32)
VNPQTRPVRKARLFDQGLPGFVRHPSFARPNAEAKYDPATAVDADAYSGAHMPDEVSRDTTRRMHYAAYRMHAAKTRRELARWRGRYLDLRDRVVVGNRKLIYRAVRAFAQSPAVAEDLAADCHVVLIQAVVAYNPWIGIRFSTYAYTCLLRALSRLTKKAARDWSVRAVSFDAFHDGEPPVVNALPSQVGGFPLDEFFRAEHPLLSDREKTVLARRFNLNDRPDGSTLEQVGAALGLSKERVRQVQAAAISKLRQALAVSP